MVVELFGKGEAIAGADGGAQLVHPGDGEVGDGGLGEFGEPAERPAGQGEAGAGLFGVGAIGGAEFGHGGTFASQQRGDVEPFHASTVVAAFAGTVGSANGVVVGFGNAIAFQAGAGRTRRETIHCSSSWSLRRRGLVKN
jgi:hypothetical protein